MDDKDQSYQSSVRQTQSTWFNGGSAGEIDSSLEYGSSLAGVRSASQDLTVPLLEPLGPAELNDMIPTSSLSEVDFDVLNTPRQSHHQDACTSSSKLETPDSWVLSTEKTLNGLVMLLDQSNIVISASKAFHHILGLDMQDILGVEIHAIMHPADKARFRSSFSVLVSTEYPVLCRYRLQNRIGSYIDFVSVCQVLTGNVASVTHDTAHSDRYTIVLISQTANTGRSLTRQLQTQNRKLHSLQQRIIEMEASKHEAESHTHKHLGESSQARKHSVVGDGVLNDTWQTNWSHENLHPDWRLSAIKSSQDSERLLMQRETASSRDPNRAGWAEKNPTVGRRPMSNSARGRVETEAHVCYACGTNNTPEWRKGPKGPKTLCNACGLKWSKRISRDNKKDVSF